MVGTFTKHLNSTNATTTAPTTTAATTTSTAPTATEVPTTTAAVPVGLGAVCTFDDSIPKITCHASGTTQGSQLRWESNIWGWSTGPSYEIPLEQEYQLVPEVVVTLQECDGSACMTVGTTVDTSVLVPSFSEDSTDLTGAPTTTPPAAATASATAGGFSADCSFDSVQRRIWCQASGYSDKTHFLTWGAGSEWGPVGGTYEYLLTEDWQLIPETVVTVEDCGGPDCVKIQVAVDTSSVAISPAGIKLLACADEGVTWGQELTCRAEVSGDVGFIKWGPESGGVTWSSAETSGIILQDLLVHQFTFWGDGSTWSQAGNQEVTFTACTLSSGDPASCAEETAVVNIGPMTAADLVRTTWTGGYCEGEGSPNLSVAPIAPEQLDLIIPLGAVNGGHPIPIAHQYWAPRGDVVADIRAPADGYIISLTNWQPPTDGLDQSQLDELTGEDYEVQYVIEVSCDFYLTLTHVIGVPESIREVLGDQFSVNPRIAVSAGDILGQHHSGFKVDFSLTDLTREEVHGSVDPPFVAVPDGEVGKSFNRNPLEYFDEPLRSSLTDKSLRTVEPRGGFFAYDVHGTAQGSWFQEGTGGVSGVTSAVYNPYEHYSFGHLALIPDNLEPFRLRVGIGDGFQDDDQAHIWGVTGDAPEFNTVTPESGPTTYEIRQTLPCDGSPITVPSRARNFGCNAHPMGTLLIELLDARTMRVEVFFNVSPTSGPTFTGNARTYVR